MVQRTSNEVILGIGVVSAHFLDKKIRKESISVNKIQGKISQGVAEQRRC
jgi:hypothetical protein